MMRNVLLLSDVLLVLVEIIHYHLSSYPRALY